MPKLAKWPYFATDREVKGDIYHVHEPALQFDRMASRDVKMCVKQHFQDACDGFERLYGFRPDNDFPRRCELELADKRDLKSRVA